jgi:hypothetical protein
MVVFIWREKKNINPFLEGKKTISIVLLEFKREVEKQHTPILTDLSIRPRLGGTGPVSRRVVVG